MLVRKKKMMCVMNCDLCDCVVGLVCVCWGCVDCDVVMLVELNWCGGMLMMLS